MLVFVVIRVFIVGIFERLVGMRDLHLQQRPCLARLGVHDPQARRDQVVVAWAGEPRQPLPVRAEVQS